MTEKMAIRKPRLPSDVGWHDIEISDNKDPESLLVERA
jgi:hypothetical protein